jgi:hypothetical protein
MIAQQPEMTSPSFPSTQQYTFGKDDFQAKLNSALAEYENLQNTMNSFQAKLSGQRAKPKPAFQPQISSYPQNFSKQRRKYVDAPSTANIRQEFKEICRDAETTLSQLNNNPNPYIQHSSFKFTPIETDNNNNANYNESYFTSGDIGKNIERNENLEMLKISNQVLNKSNLDLKNYNKVLQIELHSFKNALRGGNNFPLTQYDTNVSIYIDTLKMALNTSQMSNMELMEIFNKLKEQNERITLNNQRLKEQTYKLSNEIGMCNTGTQDEMPQEENIDNMNINENNLEQLPQSHEASPK